jgi:ketosteroid isomerase-like protein
MSIQLLEAFGAAWNAHDLEALLSMVTDDCVFETAAGAEVFGNRFVGKAALREAFPMAWITWPDARNGLMLSTMYQVIEGSVNGPFSEQIETGSYRKFVELTCLNCGGD